MQPVLELRDISKSFGPVDALVGVNLSLFAGEVLALLGDNGAGKSTLIKIIAGVHTPDSGEMRIRGRRVDPRSFDVRRARRMGIETVYQERSLGEKQAIWRNVFMGRHLTHRFGLIDVAREKAIAEQILMQHLGLHGAGMDPRAPVTRLSGGERQGLAIGRAMYFQSETVILDEPTTALSLKEVGKVLAFIEQIRASGKSCILVTHNLAHAFNAADRFVIMEKGRLRMQYAKNELTLESLNRNMLDIANGLKN